MSQEDTTLRDDEWDARYFGLINEFSQKYASRYETQTDELLKMRSLKIEFQGANIEFKITPKGCSYRTNDPQGQLESSSWIRMGWGKSAKRKALPYYFAEAEASVIINQEN
ncbi:MAG: hypothetical protein FGM60_05585 [Candidatus Planktophila sp.]|nr:hypothetical protein [Candidatus Planktophila sp.]